MQCQWAARYSCTLRLRQADHECFVSPIAVCMVKVGQSVGPGERKNKINNSKDTVDFDWIWPRWFLNVVTDFIVLVPAELVEERNLS